MYSEHANAPPINPLPPMVVALFLIVAGIEVALLLAEAGYIGGPTAIGWRLKLVQNYSFVDQVFNWMAANRTFPLEHLVRFVTYPFIQRGFVDAVFVGVFILALGRYTADALGQWVMLLLFVASAALGALAYGIILDEPGALVGGNAGAFGLIGGFTWVQFISLGEQNENRLRAFRLIAMFMGIQLLWKLLFGTNNDWVAELFAFGAGFLLSVIFGPGGLFRLKEVLSQLRDR